MSSPLMEAARWFYEKYINPNGSAGISGAVSNFPDWRSHALVSLNHHNLSVLAETLEMDRKGAFKAYTPNYNPFEEEELNAIFEEQHISEKICDGSFDQPFASDTIEAHVKEILLLRLYYDALKKTPSGQSGENARRFLFRGVHDALHQRCCTLLHTMDGLLEESTTPPPPRPPGISR